MKKTLVAAAALATLGTAAFAQSSVTLYGRIDASLGNTQSKVGGVTVSDPGAQISSGAQTGSRWGLKGSEDLGGGLKANFTLEQGFNVDDGSAVNAANQFHRQAFVGLEGGFGTLNIGRQYDLIDQFYGNYDAHGNGGFAAHYAWSYNPSAAVLAGYGIATTPTTLAAAQRQLHAGLGDYIVRQNNAVQYASPNMGGFQARVLWAPGEDKVPGTNSAGNNYGFSLNYAGGPFAIGGAYQVNKAGGQRAVEQYVLGASYDFGVAKLFGQYQAGKNKNAALVGNNRKDDGYNIGVQVPFGAFALTAAYATEDQKAFGSKVSDTAAFGVTGTYSLSKRTSVYAGYRHAELDFVAAGVPTTKERKYGVGLIHNF